MTDYKIYKYPVPDKSSIDLDLPLGAKILSVEEEDNKIVLYAMVIPQLSLKIINMRVIETGAAIDFSPNEYKFIGTVKLDGGKLMLHVFYKD
jgi:hypothetical protein